MNDGMGGSGEAPLPVWSFTLGELTPSAERRSLSLALASAATQAPTDPVEMVLHLYLAESTNEFAGPFPPLFSFSRTTARRISQYSCVTLFFHCTSFTR